jgi:ankyrin repeat protein
VVRALLDRGADPNHAQTGTGQTALMWAVAEEHPEAAGELLRAGARVSARTAAGFTPLLFAARQPNLDSVRRLLDAGANVNEAAVDGSSPLVVATVRGRTDIATLLLERGADPNAAGAGFTALHWAAGSWPTILSGAGGIVSDDDEWRTMAGLTHGKIPFVKSLLAHGADPNARLTRMPPRVGIGSAIRGSLAGATPFLLAAMAADTATMRVLLAGGADPQLATAQRVTALMLAAGLNREVSVSFVTEAAALDAVRLMLSLGGDINAGNNEGDTALHGAAFIKSDPVVRLLVESGAAVNATNVRGETPLTAAEQVVQGGSRVRARARTPTGDLLRELGGR